jgi:dTDP-4-dehydrorhamnose reductase
MAQTVQCHTVLVVDNGSSDGTADIVSSRWPDKVKLHRISKNSGAAGGFNMGMKLGYAEGVDCVWLMDDDVIPEPEALEQLLKANELLEGLSIPSAFVISVARGSSGALTNVPQVDEQPNELNYANWPLLLEYGLVPVTRSTFVSILLRRDTITEYGFPISRMFIWGEDTEYTLRITRKAPGYIVGASKVVHKRAQDGALDIRTESNPDRVKYHYYRYRNLVYNSRRYSRKRQMARIGMHQVKLSLVLLCRGHITKAALVVLGTLGGLFFNPGVESKEISEQTKSDRQQVYVATQ